MSAAGGVFAQNGNNSTADPKRKQLGIAFWLLVLYLFFEYVRPQSVVGALAPLRIPFILSLVLPMIWLASADKQPAKDSLVKLMVAFVALVAISVTYAVNTFWVFETFKFMVVYLSAVVLPVTALVTTPRRLSVFFNCWIVIHVLLALWSVTHQGRGTGSFLADENDLSLALNMAIPYAYYMLQRPGQPIVRRLLYIAAVAVLSAGVIASESRGGFLGLVSVFFGIILFSRQRIRNLLVVAVFALIGLAFVSGEYLNEMQTITDTEDSTRNDRMYSWRRGWEMFLDNPVLGVGASNYPWRVVEYEQRSDEYRRGEQRLHGGRVAHSLYFTLIPELGLVGIGLFTAMTWIMVRRLFRIVRAEAKRPGLFADAPELPLLARAMIVSMFGLFVSGAFISVLYYPHFWVLIGFTIALGAAAAAVPGWGTEPARSAWAGHRQRSPATASAARVFPQRN